MCEFHHSGDPLSREIVRVLETQLERCGPSNLTQIPCPAADPGALWFLAGFLSGVLVCGFFVAIVAVLRTAPWRFASLTGPKLETLLNESEDGESSSGGLGGRTRPRLLRSAAGSRSLA